MTPRPALHLPLNGSLAGTAANVAYFATGNGALRYRDADLAGRQCALVEVGGTNLATNPYAWNDATNITSFGSGAISGASTEAPLLAARSLRVAASGDLHGANFRSGIATLGDGASLTISGRIHAIGDGLVRARANFRHTDASSLQGVWSSSVVLSPASPVELFAPAITGTGGKTVDRLDIECRTDGAQNVVFYLAAASLELVSSAGSSIPEIDSGGSLLTGYAWSGTPHASTSTRALTTIEADYDSTIEHIFCRYSEDLGETWATASLTSATTFGSYASFDLTSNVLTIESSRALMVRDVAVYDVELLPVHEEQIISAIETGTFGEGRKPLYIPAGNPRVFVNVRK